MITLRIGREVGMELCRGLSAQPPLKVWYAADLAGFAEWLGSWQEWPERDIFTHPAYVQLYADGDRNHAVCAAWEAGGVRVLYPFILRDLTVESYWTDSIGPATDLATPYGYGGPVAWGEGDWTAAFAEFWTAFDAWAESQGVVAEFVRFALQSPALTHYPGQRVTRLDNIVRTLDAEEEAIWRDFKPKVRRNIRRAEAYGVQIAWDPTGARLDDFLRIYEHTLKRRAADKKYFFPRRYFEQIHRTLPGQFTYCFGVHDGEVVEAELVLLSPRTAYSFLGGTNGSSFSVRPNDLLKYELIRWAKEQGKRQVVLGGGQEPDDGIFRYKRGFAPHGAVPYYIGQRVLRPDVYNALVEARRVQAEAQGVPWSPRACYFPRYRA